MKTYEGEVRRKRIASIPHRKQVGTCIEETKRVEDDEPNA